MNTQVSNQSATQQTKTLSDRMKEYEDVNRTYLMRRTPVIIRIDGRSFHTFTHPYRKPYDDRIIKAMQDAAFALVRDVSGAAFAYGQSDEISILLQDYSSIETEPWFAYNLNKLVSLSASITTATFNQSLQSDRLAYFDSRAFNLPQSEVVNYFIWRQQDAIRNSIQGTAQEHFSKKEIFKLKSPQLLEKLQDIGIDWNTYPVDLQRGWAIRKQDIQQENSPMKRTVWALDTQIPLFKEDRSYVELTLPHKQH